MHKFFRISDYCLVKHIRLGTKSRQEDKHKVSGHPLECQDKKEEISQGNYDS